MHRKRICLRSGMRGPCRPHCGPLWRHRPLDERWHWQDQEGGGLPGRSAPREQPRPARLRRCRCSGRQAAGEFSRYTAGLGLQCRTGLPTCWDCLCVLLISFLAFPYSAFYARLCRLVLFSVLCECERRFTFSVYATGARAHRCIRQLLRPRFVVMCRALLFRARERVYVPDPARDYLFMTRLLRHGLRNCSR